MLLDSPSVERLIEAFRRLPGIGKRSAERMALHVLSAPAEEARMLSESVREAHDAISKCSICRNLTEVEPCRICTDERRDATIICVVEHPSGAMAIERGRAYKGKYHVLHGALSPLDGVGPDELELERLFRRLPNESIQEVIVATNATAEGEATALYLSRQLNKTGVKATRIAHGVPMGGGLEYTDELTLTHAMEGRQEM